LALGAPCLSKTVSLLQLQQELEAGQQVQQLSLLQEALRWMSGAR
jgi:hypothetical protein